MKPKVYVLTGVFTDFDEDKRYIIGIYSSNEAAEKESQKIIEAVAYYRLRPSELMVEEFILDKTGEVS